MKRSVFLASAAVAALGWSLPAAAQDDQIIMTDCNPTDQCADDEVGQQITFGHPIRPDAILVSAQRIGGLFAPDFTGSSTIVTRRQIEDRQTRNIEDVLRDVPGIAVSSVAGQTQIRLRGTEANHVLVLVDGIEVSDPSSGEFDIGTLQAEIGSWVEVLRGPQSALYGNDAIGGVVAYRSGDFDGVGGMIEAGTNDTINGAFRVGKIGDVSASLSGTIVTTDGEPNARRSMVAAPAILAATVTRCPARSPLRSPIHSNCALWAATRRPKATATIRISASAVPPRVS